MRRGSSDGNHPSGTEHRIKELRTTKSAARPGQALVVLDPAARLIVDVVPCEDAHVQERTLIGQLLKAAGAGEVWMADRNFCTTRMLFGIAQAGAFSLIRYHATAASSGGNWGRFGRAAGPIPDGCRSSRWKSAIRPPAAG
jgi:hypothetical protein